MALEMVDSDAMVVDGTPTSTPRSAQQADGGALKDKNTYTDYSRVPFDDDVAAPSQADRADDAGDKQTTTNDDNFPTKLHRILSRPDLAHIISWLPHGRAWKVHRQDVFASLVIPEYYNHSKYTSFNRQVNGWGFRRIGSGPDQTAYYHELFLRGMPHLTRRMRRPVPVHQPEGADGRKGKGLRRRSAADRRDDPDFYAMARTAPLPMENPPGYIYAAEDAIVPEPPFSGVVRSSDRRDGGGRSAGKGGVAAQSSLSARPAGKNKSGDASAEATTAAADGKDRNKKKRARKRLPPSSFRSKGKSNSVTPIPEAETSRGRAKGKIRKSPEATDGTNGGSYDAPMSMLLDKQVKIMEMQKQIMMQMQQNPSGSSFGQMHSMPMHCAAQSMREGMMMAHMQDHQMMPMHQPQPQPHLQAMKIQQPALMQQQQLGGSNGMQNLLQMKPFMAQEPNHQMQHLAGLKHQMMQQPLTGQPIQPQPGLKQQMKMQPSPMMVPPRTMDSDGAVAGTALVNPYPLKDATQLAMAHVTMAHAIPEPLKIEDMISNAMGTSPVLKPKNGALGCGNGSSGDLAFKEQLNELAGILGPPEDDTPGGGGGRGGGGSDRSPTMTPWPSGGGCGPPPPTQVYPLMSSLPMSPMQSSSNSSIMQFKLPADDHDGDVHYHVDKPAHGHRGARAGHTDEQKTSSVTTNLSKFTMIRGGGPDDDTGHGSSRAQGPC